MKKNKYFYAVLSSVIILFAYTSCQDGLVPSPAIEQIQYSTSSTNDGVIPPPINISATHGGYRSITLSWSTVPNAVQYLIYAGDTTFDDFQQVAETKGAVSSYTLSVPAGTSRYYAVRAVNYKGTKSSSSNIVYGSSLATPIITSITQDTDGTGTTVNWWMDNCKSTTYLSSVRYEVTCYKEDRKTIVETANISVGSDSAKITGLSPKTHYYYEVAAYILSNQDKMEKSDIIDAETAHRLIPNPPENLKVTQGTDKNAITLSWDLPEFVDVKVSDEVYERHPVYFTIERKEKAADDSTYTQLVKYLGTINDDTSKIIFSCISNTSNSENVTVTAAVSENAETNTEYPDYISLSTLTYADKTAEHGKQYTYKVQSYVDGVSKTVSADSAAAAADGWLISIPSFKAQGNYTKDENNNFTKITVSFEAEMETFGRDDAYNFIIEQTKTSLTGDGQPETSIYQYNNINSLNGDIKEFTDPAAEEGYYKYTMYITAPGTTDLPEDPDTNPYIYYHISPAGKIIITADGNKIPEIENFTVAGGYADKFKLSWTYNSDYSYTVSWIPYENGQPQQTESLQLSVNDLGNPEDGALVTYEHPAASGDCREYTLEANNGLSVPQHFEMKKTLGTAKPVFAIPEYDRITVTWKSVQEAADTYTVNAYYSDDGTEESLITQDNTEITKNADDVYTCTITNPKGYDSAVKSGKPVTFNVTAVNNDTGAKTTAAAAVCTLGPALTNCTVTDSTAESISIQWNKVDGAAGYIIYRTKYSNSSASAIERADKYYINASTMELSVNGETENSGRTVPDTTANICKLTDIYKEADDATSSYQINQAQIPWGIPYGYTVLPVAASGSSDDFSFETGSLELNAEFSKVAYSELTDVKASATGYGINPAASKAENASIITITWDEPYKAASKVPSLYSRLSGEETWTFEKTVSPGTVTTTFSPDEKFACSAFEFSVCYNQTSSTATFVKSFETKLSETKDAESPTEQQNTGYLFSLQNLTANYAGSYNSDTGTYNQDENYYAEQISWTPYDFSKRALGPEGYEISIKNQNISDSWKQIAVLDKNGYVTSSITGTDDVIINAPEKAASLIIKPDSIISGKGVYTDGLLKVLRDAKHYYKITAVRTFTSEGKSISIKTDIGDDMSVYAYRQITPNEFARAATLAMAIGIKNAVNNQGIKWTAPQSGSTTAGAPGSGSTSIKTSGGVFSEVTSTVTFSDYKPVMETKGGQSVTFMTIGNSAMLGNTDSNFATSCPIRWATSGEPMPIKGPDDTKLYSGSIVFNAITKDSAAALQVSYDGLNKELSTTGNCALPFKDTGWYDEQEDWK